MVPLACKAGNQWTTDDHISGQRPKNPNSPVYSCNWASPQPNSTTGLAGRFFVSFRSRSYRCSRVAGRLYWGVPLPHLYYYDSWVESPVARISFSFLHNHCGVHVLIDSQVNRARPFRHHDGFLLDSGSWSRRSPLVHGFLVGFSATLVELSIRRMHFNEDYPVSNFRFGWFGRIGGQADGFAGQG